MGVKGLWEILQDVKTTRSLNDLRGQTVAIDLAEWICEAELVRHMQGTVKNPYLRNLFYRVSILIDHGVEMVFVADGRPPDLKRDTIAKRLGKESGSFLSGSRSRLNSKFKECCQLLDQIGIPWLKSDGEAEAVCAYLNNKGLVDACVTSDGDVFLYGAQKVYRNFSTDKRNSEIEFFEMATIKKELNLSRRSLVSLALLLGCDYCEGVHGIGKVQAQEFLRIHPNVDPIDRLRNLAKIEKPVSNQDKKASHCSFCKHEGSKKDHAKNNCASCFGDCKAGRINDKKCVCMWHMNEKQRKNSNLEISIWESAKQIPSFPDQRVIKEFLRPRNISTDKQLHRKKPDLKKIVETLCDKLDWSEERCVEKTLPIVTNWMYGHTNDVNHFPVKPLRIIKERKKDGKQVFEISWEIEDFEVENITTLEPQDGFKQAFPTEVEKFISEKEKLKKIKESKKTKNTKTQKLTKQDRKVTEFFAKKKTSLVLDKVEKPPVEADYKEKTEREITEIVDDHPQSAELQKTPTKRDEESLRSLASIFGAISISDTTKECATKTDSELSNDDTKDISFGLNFSLGSSLLNTPVVAHKERHPGSIDSLIFTPMSDSKENCNPETPDSVKIDQPVGKTVDATNAEPGSPVFMTLAERIRNRGAR